MITGDKDRVEAVTYATSDDINEVVDLIGDMLEGSRSYNSYDDVSARIADDLNEEYKGWWGENRYKITIVVDRVK